MIGANARRSNAGKIARFQNLMLTIGLDVPISGTPICQTKRHCRRKDRTLSAHHPAGFTLGGTGVASLTREEFEELAKRGLELSPVSEILVEESLLGWKEI